MLASVSFRKSNDDVVVFKKKWVSKLGSSCRNNDPTLNYSGSQDSNGKEKNVFCQRHVEVRRMMFYSTFNTINYEL